MRKLVKSMVTGLHEEIGRWLAERYRTVVVPEYRLEDFARSPFLNPRALDVMRLWRHGKFLKTLREKGCDVVVLSEEYTSATCGRCGSQRTRRGEREFVCRRCGLQLNRDANGARNLMLKWLTERNEGESKKIRTLRAGPADEKSRQVPERRKVWRQVSLAACGFVRGESRTGAPQPA